MSDKEGASLSANETKIKAKLKTTNLPISDQIYFWQCVRERERPHHVERRITIRRSESPAPASGPQRPGSSQSLPRQGASPAMGRSTNKKGELRIVPSYQTSRDH